MKNIKIMIMTSNDRRLMLMHETATTLAATAATALF